jgi:hypothetical protein
MSAWTVISEKLHEGKYYVAGRGPRVVEGEEQVCRLHSGPSLTERNKAHDRACLIAAAPELLEALEGCLAQLERDTELLYDQGQPPTEPSIMNVARAAIAKARGQS